MISTLPPSCLRPIVERPDAADAVPGILLAGRFALAFVAFQEAGHEELFGQRGELHAARFAVADDAIGVVEIDHFDARPAAAARSTIIL